MLTGEVNGKLQRLCSCLQDTGILKTERTIFPLSNIEIQQSSDTRRGIHVGLDSKLSSCQFILNMETSKKEITVLNKLHVDTVLSCAEARN